MSRYIDADVLIDDLIHNRSFYPALVAGAIKNTPTADVVDVEVVSEIFEEIDKMLYKLLNDPHYIVGDMCWDVKELKKKFTGNVYPDCSICSLCERDVIICQEEGRCMKNA
jgi:hypothetical protein